MVSRQDSNKARQKRHTRVRAKISGTADCPRLSVYRSLNHIYAQLIDDVNAVTLASAATVEKDFEYGGNTEAAKRLASFLQNVPQKKALKSAFLTEAATSITVVLQRLQKARAQAA